MSRLTSPREQRSAAVSASSTAEAAPMSSPRPNQHLSPRPSPSLSSALTSPLDHIALSPVVSVSPPVEPPVSLPVQLTVPPAVPNLPTLHFPFYSSTSTCAPYGLPPSPHYSPAVLTQARLPRCFFRPSISADSVGSVSGKRQRAAQASTTAESTSTFTIRSYRRHLPAVSILESLRRLTWPHKPTSLTPQSRDTYTSLLPPDEQSSLHSDTTQQLTEAASSLLAVLAELDELCSRPFEPSLHRIRPNQWQPPSHSPLTDRLVAPFLSSLGLLRDGEEWAVGEEGVGEVKQRVRWARAELLSLVANRLDGEGAVERTGVFVVESEGRQQGERKEEEANDGLDEESSDSDSKDECGEYDDRTATAPAPLIRHKSLHSTPMAVRPMPTVPTTARHHRSTFKHDSSRTTSAHRPPLPTHHSDTADLSYSSRTEAASHPKTLTANVAGDRRTLPIALPRTFLSTAPTIESTEAGSAAPFTVQPAVLDVGPLLVGCTYTATLLLTNTSSRYSRYELLLPPAVPQQSQSPFSLSFAFRRGGLSAGLSKPLTAIIVCTAAGSFDCDVVVAGEGASVRVSVCADCMGDADEWRRAQNERNRLSAGELGQTIASELPGSLKTVHSLYGRVKEVNCKAAEEEFKEQLLSAAVLCKWRNKPQHN